ncbi:MAG: peptidylprolyl isomerase [Pirellulaceae bacterium]
MRGGGLVDWSWLRSLPLLVESQLELSHTDEFAFRRPKHFAEHWWPDGGWIAFRGLLRAALLGCLSLLSAMAIAQEASKPLGYVGKMPITAAEVDLLLGREAGSSGKLESAALANAVELLAKQRQALQALRSIGLASSRAEIDLWLLENAPASQANSEADEVLSYLSEKSNVTRENYLDYVSFRLSWQRYLAKHLNAANLATHFAKQKRRFDGTTFDIAIVSIPVPPGAGDERQAATEKLAGFARAVRAERQAQSSASAHLNDMANEYGLAASSKSRVRGIGDLEHSVIDALLQLKAEQLSEPFNTAGGVHLVQLENVYDGGRELAKVQGEVRLHMLVFLLDRLAERGAKQLPFVASN